MIAGLDPSELVVFKFSNLEAKNLNWKHSKEFELAGEWYDIVYTDTLGNDSLQYWLFWDHEETKLNRQLADLVANALGNDPATKDKNSNFNHFSKDLYCIQLGELMKPNTCFNKLGYPESWATIQHGFAPISPPPELV